MNGIGRGPRRIGVLGAGPAGLYFALLAKKSDPSREITVVERNPPDATFGWGVVFSDETMGSLRDADRETYQRILDSFARWGAIDVRFRGETVRSRGHVFSGTPRRGLLMILQERCRGLGVRLRFDHEVPSIDAFPADGFDLIVAADGVSSGTRRGHSDWFGPDEDVHVTKYVWYGTDLVFDAFTFIFRDTPHGMFQVHAYPFDAGTSTFIVETLTSTWERAGLAEATEQESMAFCEDLFAEELAGHKLMSNRSLWMSFVTLRCGSWHHGNVVLVGDAAHTAHFTIGSGTKLAMEDAIALAAALDVHGDDVERALTEYELERQPMVERFQEAARESATYFESVGRYASFQPLRFAFNLLTRSGRVTHLELERRDPAFVARVDAAFAAEPPSTGPAGPLVPPPPLHAPFALGDRRLTNRIAVNVRTLDDAVDGTMSEGSRAALVLGLESGAGLMVTEPVAVSAVGRVTPGAPGLWSDRHLEDWATVEARASATGPSPAVALVLGHGGRRASSRPLAEGADRPLRAGGWETVAPSALPYTPRHPAPRALGPDELGTIVGEFGNAARLARRTAARMLIVDMAHGHLLASFLSPLTNRREDDCGGSLEARMRFPLRVFDAVGSEWPDDRLLGVRLNCTDLARGGFDIGDAVVMARELRSRRCDLIQVSAGQTVSGGQPDYARLYLIPLADRIRNDAGVPVMVGGNITKPDDANTILAAGRADLCLVDRRIYASAGEEPERAMEPVISGPRLD
jgi:anthraniloyl-CoA monooxygenase